jgi:hypothetical protein
MVATPTSPPPLPPSATPHCRVLERSTSPSPDHDTHPRGCQGGSCAIHGWDYPSWVTLVHDPSSSSRQGEEEGGEEEEDECQISVVNDPVGAPVIRWTARISIGPRGRPQGPLAPRTTTTMPTSPTTSFAASGPLSALPSSEAGPSSSETPPDHKSPCSNWLLCRFTHHTTPSGTGRAPGSWDSTVGPSR